MLRAGDRGTVMSVAREQLDECFGAGEVRSDLCTGALDPDGVHDATSDLLPP